MKKKTETDKEIQKIDFGIYAVIALTIIFTVLFILV